MIYNLKIIFWEVLRGDGKKIINRGRYLKNIIRNLKMEEYGC